MTVSNTVFGGPTLIGPEDKLKTSPRRADIVYLSPQDVEPIDVAISTALHSLGMRGFVLVSRA